MTLENYIQEIDDIFEHITNEFEYLEFATTVRKYTDESFQRVLEAAKEEFVNFYHESLGIGAAELLTKIQSTFTELMVLAKINNELFKSSIDLMYSGYLIDSTQVTNFKEFKFKSGYEG